MQTYISNRIVLFLHIIAFLCIMSACSTKPSYVLSSGAMEDVLYDVHKAHFLQEQKGIEISDEESQRMYDEKSRIFATRPEAKVMEGVMELQRKMKADGLKIVVVTGSGQHSLLDKLVHDFEGLIEPGMIVSSFDVKRGKPNPEPYIKGLMKAGVDPWEAIVVENAPLGVRAAQAANIFTVAVNTGPLPDKMLADEGADLIFSRMTDFRDKWEVFLEG